MQNDQGKVVDLYIPRKCSATIRVLHPKDHSSVQINVGKDTNGVYSGDNFTLAIAGFIRTKGDSDAAINRLLYENKFLTFSE